MMMKTFGENFQTEAPIQGDRRGWIKVPKQLSAVGSSHQKACPPSMPPQPPPPQRSNSRPNKGQLNFLPTSAVFRRRPNTAWSFFLGGSAAPPPTPPTPLHAGDSHPPPPFPPPSTEALGRSGSELPSPPHTPLPSADTLVGRSPVCCPREGLVTRCKRGSEEGRDEEGGGQRRRQRNSQRLRVVEVIPT